MKCATKIALSLSAIAYLGWSILDFSPGTTTRPKPKEIVFDNDPTTVTKVPTSIEPPLKPPEVIITEKEPVIETAPFKEVVPTPSLTKKEIECELRPYIKSIKSPDYDISLDLDKVNPKLKTEYKDSVIVIESFLEEMTHKTDKAIDKKDKDLINCVLDNIVNWAENSALTGDMLTVQSNYDRIRITVGLSLVLLKLKDNISIDQKKIILPWMQTLIQLNDKFLDAVVQKRDNYKTWLGVSIAAISLLDNNEKNWQYAKQIAKDALSNIREDGTIVLEMRKGKRALFNHAQAASALFLLVEILEIKKESLYEFNNRALQRLGKMVSVGLEYPVLFETLSGQSQKYHIKNGYAWLSLHNERYKPTINDIKVQENSPYIGGKLKNLFKEN